MHKQIEKKEKNWILKSEDSLKYSESVARIAEALGIDKGRISFFAFARYPLDVRSVNLNKEKIE